MSVDEEIKTIFVSEIDMLDNFDIVRLIDNESQEFIGYFLNEKYQKIIRQFSEKKDKLHVQAEK